LRQNIARIEADKTTGQVTAYDNRDVILAAYPATVGSEDNASPGGTHRVNGVARMPVFRYNPKVNFKQGKNDKVRTVPKGPNGPVGSIWFDPTEPTYGIHGTPDPDLVNKIGSSLRSPDELGRRGASWNGEAGRRCPVRQLKVSASVFRSALSDVRKWSSGVRWWFFSARLW
jgi:hypothetical protein